jgi:hypothetical protein
MVPRRLSSCDDRGEAVPINVPWPLGAPLCLADRPDPIVLVLNLDVLLGGTQMPAEPGPMLPCLILCLIILFLAVFFRTFLSANGKYSGR